MYKTIQKHQRTIPAKLRNKMKNMCRLMVLNQLRVTDPFQNLMKTMDYIYRKIIINHKTLFIISKALAN